MDRASEPDSVGHEAAEFGAASGEGDESGAGAAKTPPAYRARKAYLAKHLGQASVVSLEPQDSCVHPQRQCATICSYMERVGIRELRQNLSRHLRKVERGATLEVTERGQPVALLTPLPMGGSLDRLAALGRLVRPPRASLGTLPPPKQPQPHSLSLRDALDQEREERL